MESSPRQNLTFSGKKLKPENKLSHWSLLLIRAGLLLLIYSPYSTAQTEYGNSSPDTIFQEIIDDYEAFAHRTSQDRWEKMSASFFERQKDTLDILLGRLSNIGRENLSETNQLDFEVFNYILKNERDVIYYKTYLIPFNAEGGFYNAFSYRVNRYDFSDPEEAQNYLERLREYINYFEGNVTLMKRGIQQGIVSPRVVAKNYAVLIKPFITRDLQKNILYSPLRKVGESAVAPEHRRALETLLQDTIIPLYEMFDEFMREEYLPAAKEEVGISAIPKGKELYEQRIRYFSSLDMTPDSVFNLGQSEVQRIRSEMESIISSLDFEGSFDDFLTFLREDPQFYVTEPRDLLKEASYLAKRIDGMLPQYFNVLPRLPYGVIPVPAAIAPNYTGGRYSGGSWEDHRAGNYWVNTHKLESRPLYILPALTLHEAVPGHHLQISLAAEIEEMRDFRRTNYISAFGEGWALYCEWLGNEMGIYETPYEQFGRLTYEMWRACRLVVDVGMHYKGWDRQKALTFLSSNTALSLHECNTEIDRYIGWPGQAVSYKIGELKIRSLRKVAEKELGEDFDLRSFHDLILSNGSVPLYILDQEVHKYIESQKSS